MEYKNKKTNNDRWIVEHVFPNEHGKFFVEAGACNGIGASSCYVLEKYLRWTGICVEPNSNYFEELVNNRPNSICENLCLSNTNGTVTYIQGDNNTVHPMLGGIESNLIKYRHDYQKTVNVGQKVTKESITLYDLLKKHNAPQTIHYLAMDIEGSELPVLEAFPFEEYCILAISIEGIKCNDLLTAKGYINVKNPYNTSATYEQYFIHKSIAVEHNIPLNTSIAEFINTAKNYKTEKPQKAIATYQQALKFEPNNALVLALLAIVQKEQGNLSAAISNLQKAIAIEPNRPWVHSNLGNALQAQDRYAEATQAYYEAIARNCEIEVPIWVWQSLGRVLILQERWGEAVKIYTQALKLHPDNTEFRDKLEEIKSKHQQIEASASTGDRNLYYDLGKKQAEQGKWSEAIACFRQAIELQPTQLKIYQDLGTALIKQGKIDDGLRVYQYLFKIDPNPSGKAKDVSTRKLMARWQNEINKKPQNSSKIEHFWGNCLGKLGFYQEAVKYHYQAIVTGGYDWQNFLIRNYEFTLDHFTNNIPIWSQYLSQYIKTPEVHAIEIGSLQGMSSCWLLDNILTHPTATLTCLDLKFQPQFDSNIEKTGVAEKVTKVTGWSEASLKSLPVEKYDFIYIDGGHLSFDVIQDAFLDGRHLSFNVIQDALLAWDLIKVGGHIIFDDYYWKPSEDSSSGPKVAVDLFLYLFEDEIEILHQEWQLILRKTSPRISFTHNTKK